MSKNFFLKKKKKTKNFFFLKIHLNTEFLNKPIFFYSLLKRRIYQSGVNVRVRLFETKNSYRYFINLKTKKKVPASFQRSERYNVRPIRFSMWGRFSTRRILRYLNFSIYVEPIRLVFRSWLDPFFFSPRTFFFAL